MGMTACLLEVQPEELNWFRIEPASLQVLIDDEVDGQRVHDIDKSWEGILFLLTGKGASGLEEPATNLSRALFSGQLIDPEQDLGSGPAHYLEPAQVAEVARELTAIRIEDLAARFDPEEMMRQQIYPMIWDRVDDDLKGYLLDYFDEIKIVYRTAAENGCGMITFIR